MAQTGRSVSLSQLRATAAVHTVGGLMSATIESTATPLTGPKQSTVSHHLLQDKVVIATGVGAGIGQAAASVFAREGARLVLCDIDEDSGRRTLDSLEVDDEKAVFIKCDIARREDVGRAVSLAVEKFGRLDCAFNNAAVFGPPHLLADYSEADFDRLVSVNLKGTWQSMATEIPAMVANGGGSIVNVASGTIWEAVPLMGPYIATKHGIVGLTQVAAKEYATHGIRANVILPGVTDTQMHQNFLSENPELTEPILSLMPIQRWCQPHEIAEAAAWLLSDRASIVTGSVVAADGAMTA